MDEVNDPAIDTIVFMASSQVGKALAVDTPIPVAEGWKKMGDIEVGDRVFDETGKTCQVTFVTPIMLGRECFKVAFSDGSELLADGEHRWLVHDGHGAKANYKIVTTNEIRRTQHLDGKGDKSNRYAIPVAGALCDLPAADLPVDPYALGQWLGNGNSHSAQITLNAKDSNEVAENLRACGHRVIERRIDKRAGNNAANLLIDPYERGPICTRNHDTRALGLTKKGYCAECARQHSMAHQYGTPKDPVSNPICSLARRLEQLGVLSTSKCPRPKQIPSSYLRASYKQRLDLLQGLLDSDGYISPKTGRCEFATTSAILADGFGDLLAGLGIKYRRKTKTPTCRYLGKIVQGKVAWVFSFMVYEDKPVFRLRRKRALLAARCGRRTTETERRRIVRVESVPSKPVRCIQVDSPSHLYLAGRTMIPTHNTETLLNITGYFMHQDPCAILLIEPTLEIAEAYSKDRLAPMIRDTPVLRDIIPEPRTRDGGNTLLHKGFRGGHVTLVGANSPSGLASRPIRIILGDEISRYLPSAGTEGNPLRLADARATTFWNRKKIYTSSPGIAGLCNVSREFENSDKQYFHVPCYRCGRGQVLEWKQVMWDNGRPETAHYVCCYCSAPWNDAQRVEAIFGAEEAGFGWVATATSDGVAGHSIWAAYNPWITLPNIAKKFLAAKHAQDGGDPEPLKTFTNTVLGQVWIEDAQRANPDPLIDRRENYSAELLPWQTLYLTGAIDTQDDRLEVKLVAWRAQNRIDPPEAWVVLHKIVYGDPALQTVWDDIEAYLLREYRTQDGRPLRVAATCVDSGGHHTEAVYRYCNKRSSRHVYAIRGAAGPHPIWPARAGASKKFKGIKVWTVGVDTAKDALYARLKLTAEGPGYIHFPVTSDASGAFDLTYFQQLTCEFVKTRFQKGHAIREWHKPPGARNEALDLLVYNLAALHARSVPWEILARGAPMEPPPPKDPAPGGGPVVPKPAASPPVPMQRRKVRFKF